MASRIELPSLEALSDLDIGVEPSEESGVVSLMASASDGSAVSLAWDGIAESVKVRWLDGGHERIVIERETVSKISVQRDGEALVFRVSSRSQGLFGELVVRVGRSVTVSDALLRT